MKVFISGLYGGTNPQPGIGIARSLKAAFAQAEITGIEYSNRCSGIHWQDFDEIQLQRPWEELNLEIHAEEIKNILDSGAYWISGIDLEIIWLAEIFPTGHKNLLTPPLAAVRQTRKPQIAAHKNLPVEIPAFVTTEISDWDLHTFCRENDWKIWLKGPYYEAVKTENWLRFDEARNLLADAWATEKLFLQKHIGGYEESIALAAYQGELLDCVRMRKRDLTELNKTWAGEVSGVSDEFLAPLRKIVREINWTGGAELEMVRDAENKYWLIEWNPRFPAWIHGATIAGSNLPAALIAGASGGDYEIAAPSKSGGEFTRVVLEIPVRAEFPLPPLPEPLGGQIGHSLKHPSGLLKFADRLHKLEMPDASGKPRFHLPDVPDSFIKDLKNQNLEGNSTPAVLFFETTAQHSMSEAAAFFRQLCVGKIKVNAAYSIKSNPDGRILKNALAAGFHVEAISPPEIRSALKAGFRADQIILNGPAKSWSCESVPPEKFLSVFSDSLEELELNCAKVAGGKLNAEFLGVRLRPPNIVSRFGIPVDTPENFQKLIEAVRQIPEQCRFGVHFHIASSNIGVNSWRRTFEGMMRWCRSLEKLSRRKIEIFDVGGGWFPEDFSGNMREDRGDRIGEILKFLPNVTQIVAEPGKAMAQSAMAVATRILEIRNHHADCREAVVDASIAELPMIFYYPHRILFRRAAGGEWRTLGRGGSRLLGRLCMEHDIIAAKIELPADAEIGDFLVVCDAGAYDRSMSYVFGRG